MTTSLHDYLTNLRTNVSGPAMGGGYDLIRDTVTATNTTGYSRPMWNSAKDALDNVFDRALNSGTVENLFELRETLDNDGDFSPSLTNDESMELLGALFNFSYRPETVSYTHSEPLEDILNSWCEDIGNAAHAALVAYVSLHAPEYNF